MKCFFASVECAELGLNPFETNLVVADESRGTNALCLAITPKMKSLGCKNRCRMSEIPKSIQYIVAKPRMKRYIEYAADIYDIYLDYIDPQDIHVYSIDEAFIDVTGYLKMYKKDAKEFAKFLINEIATRKHIPAAAGIGTNLYLAKVALDITAKKTKDHIGYLTEELYRETLWQVVQLLKYEINLDASTETLRREHLLDLLLERVADNEYYLTETGTDSVVNRVVNNCLVVRTNSVHLLQRSIARAHTCGKHQKCRFYHNLCVLLSCVKIVFEYKILTKIDIFPHFAK